MNLRYAFNKPPINHYPNLSDISAMFFIAVTIQG